MFSSLFLQHHLFRTILQHIYLLSPPFPSSTPRRTGRKPSSKPVTGAGKQQASHYYYYCSAPTPQQLQQPLCKAAVHNCCVRLLCQLRMWLPLGCLFRSHTKNTHVEIQSRLNWSSMEEPRRYMSLSRTSKQDPFHKAVRSFT